MSVYIFSRSSLVVCTPTPRGWRARSTRRDFQHDYVSGESLEQVEDWLQMQLTRTESVTDRQEVLERLATDLGFLQSHDPSMTPLEGAERVLQHLECGW